MLSLLSFAHVVKGADRSPPLRLSRSREVSDDAVCGFVENLEAKFCQNHPFFRIASLGEFDLLDRAHRIMYYKMSCCEATYNSPVPTT